MEQIIGRLYVGSDADYEDVKQRPGWSILRCCKDGPGGHRAMLGYTTHGAPKGDRYLSARRGNTLALNLIDPHDPALVPFQVVEEGIEFIGARLGDGDKVLVACNQGHSRGPCVALLYLRSIGEMPHSFIQSENVFRTLYPGYDPGLGMRQFCRTHWDKFERETT